MQPQAGTEVGAAVSVRRGRCSRYRRGRYEQQGGIRSRTPIVARRIIGPNEGAVGAITRVVARSLLAGTFIPMLMAITVAVRTESTSRLQGCLAPLLRMRMVQAASTHHVDQYGCHDTNTKGLHDC